MKRFAPLFGLTLLLLASCTTVQYVTVPVNYGPKLGFRPDTTTIVVINRFNPDTLKVRDQRRLGIYKASAYSAVKAAADQLKFLPHVNTINLVDSVNFVENTDSVKFIAKKYKAHYVLALSNYGIGIYREREFIDGQVVTYFSTKLKTRFLLYESNGIYSKKLNGIAEVPVVDQRYGGIGYNQYNAKVLNEASRNAALEALKDYLPYSISNERPLYADDGPLATSMQQIRRGRFDEAFKILNPLIDGSDPKLASKAAYNLAVVYEAQGDIEEAINTVKISNNKKRNDYAMELLAALMKE